MNNQNEKTENLIELFSSKNIRSLRGYYKKTYKLCLVALTINIFSGRNKTIGQNQNIEFAHNIINGNIHKKNIESIYKNTLRIVNHSLIKSRFKIPLNDRFINSCIDIMRTNLNRLKDDNICLFQAKELSVILDIKKYFGVSFLGDYHWIELDIRKGLIPTVPEMIIFNDLKVLWSDYIDIVSHINHEREKPIYKSDELKYYSNRENRENHYKLGTYHRNLVFLSVTYVESYLYNLFCSIREMDLENKDEVMHLLRNDKIQDTQIVEDVLFVIFPEIKGEIEHLYKLYKESLFYRDRYVHASPLRNKSDNSSQLIPLLNLNQDKLLSCLQTSVDLVLKINDLLPSDLNLLFWWYNDEVDFYTLKKISLTYEKAQLNNMSYLSN